jgi:hypothetical protein
MNFDVPSKSYFDKSKIHSMHLNELFLLRIIQNSKPFAHIICTNDICLVDRADMNTNRTSKIITHFIYSFSVLRGATKNTKTKRLTILRYQVSPTYALVNDRTVV